MATVTPTVVGVHLVAGPNSYETSQFSKCYLLSLTTPLYTSGDTLTITGVPTTIGNFTKNGKTVVVRGAIGHSPGRNTAGAAVFASPTVTNSSGTLTCSLCSTATGTDASTAAAKGIQILVSVYES